MGKPLKQAVEAIADAVTGENERLKEFGIVGKKVGDKIVYEYTNAAGAQAKMMAKAGDRAAIQATLTKIWGEKYGGGMANLSKTFGGMWSNLMDGLSRMSMKIMSNGAFDWMKGKLEGILAVIDRMSQDGSLDAWASEWGAKLTNFLDNAWNAGVGFAGALQTIGEGLAWTADLLGGWENLGIAVASLMGLKLVGSIGQLCVAFWTLGAAIMTTPIGWIAGGITLLVVGIVALWRNWDAFAQFVKKHPIFAGIGAMVAPGIAAITALVGAVRWLWKNWEQMTTWFKEKTPKWILKLFGADEGGGEVKGASGREGASPGATRDWGKAWGDQTADFGAPAARPSLGAAQLQRQIQESRFTSLERKESKVTVDFANLPRGAEVRQAGAPVDMDVRWDMGPAMAH